MKKDIHPEYKLTKVKCNGCGTEFETHSTVDAITVEICSNCHPFYTGKQKLVDVAGRVDRFKAAQANAADKRQVKSRKPKVIKSQDVLKDSAEQLKELKQELDKQPAHSTTGPPQEPPAAESAVETKQ